METLQNGTSTSAFSRSTRTKSKTFSTHKKAKTYRYARKMMEKSSWKSSSKCRSGHLTRRLIFWMPVWNSERWQVKRWTWRRAGVILSCMLTSIKPSTITTSITKILHNKNRFRRGSFSLTLLDLKGSGGPHPKGNDLKKQNTSIPVWAHSVMLFSAWQTQINKNTTTSNSFHIVPAS